MTDGRPTERLGSLYRTYLGEPDSELDVPLGFAVFFAGLALGLVGLLLFAVEQATASDGPVWWLRELAFVAGALGLPTVLVGVTVLLPVDRRASYAAAGGLAVILGSAVFFVSVYPQRWNVAGNDATLEGVVFFAVGLVTVLASTAAALVSYHVERAQGPAALADEESPTADDEPSEADVADLARKDYEEAMAEAEVSWGGVEKTDVSRRLTVTDDRTEIDASGFEDVAATETRDSGSNVDAAVSGLNSMRGGARREARTDGTADDEAAALAELRRREEHETQRQKHEQGMLGSLSSRLQRALDRD